MRFSLRRVVAMLGLAGLVATSVSSGPASARSSTRPRPPSAHYLGKGLLNPKADLSVPPAHDPAPSDEVGASAEPRIGDAHRFDTWSGYGTKRFPEAVTTGDFDGDGAVDVAFARSDFVGQGISVKFNLGDGTMGPAISYPSESESTDIKAGDLNGDGHLDLVVVSQGTSLHGHVVDVYLNDGSGSFMHRTSTGGDGPQKMALADLDGDGDLDLAMSGSDFSNVAAVLLNDGAGNFGSERRFNAGDDPQGVAAADFDGDGDVDVALARDDSSTLTTKVDILTNDGAAHFVRARTITALEEGSPSLVADDLNGDAKPDLVVGLVGTDHQVVMLNQGGLAFAQSAYVTGFSAWDLASGDLDADGDADVVLATLGSSSTGDMSILRNRGDGTFRALRFAAGFNPHDAAIADFDGDDRADIVVANGATETGGIHLQRPGFRFGPPGLIQTQLFVGSIEHSDLDHDGDLDLVVSQGDPYGNLDHVLIMENDGLGGFQPSQTIESGLTSDGGIGHVQPADLNGDGWDDLVWTIGQFNEPVAPIVYSLNDGAGTFGPITVFVGTDGNGYAGVGDVDRDGDVDLVVSQSTQRIAIYRNAGDATFGPAKLVSVAEFPGMVIARDLSGDGWPELVTPHNGVYGSSASLSIVPALGGGQYGRFVKYTVGQGPAQVVAADFDADGDVDLATSNNGGDDISNFNDESTTVLLNRGNGSFGAIRTYPGEDINYYLSEWAVEAVDVDGDGLVDLAVSNAMGNNVGIYRGRGDGTFDSQQVRYGVQNGAQDIDAADFTGDGRVDLVAGGYLQSVDPLFPPTGIVVLRNQSS